MAFLFCVFFGFMNQGTAQTAEPIFTVSANEVPFGGQNVFKKNLDPKTFPCISMGNKNVNNF
jgi:hypothetical protein